MPSSPSKVVQATCALVGAQAVYQRFSHRDLGGLLAQVVCLLLFCRHAAQNLGTPGNLCHLDAGCLHYGVRTAASKTSGVLREPCRGLHAVSACGQLRQSRGTPSGESARLSVSDGNNMCRVIRVRFARWKMPISFSSNLTACVRLREKGDRVRINLQIG